MLKATFVAGLSVEFAILSLVVVTGFLRWWGLIVNDDWTAPLLIAISLDVILGVLLAISTGRFKIAALGVGLLKKCAELIVVAMAYTAQRMGGADAWEYGHLTAGVVVLWEGKSIIGNAIKFGLPADDLAPIFGHLHNALMRFSDSTRTAKRQMTLDGKLLEARQDERSIAKQESRESGEIRTSADIDVINEDRVPPGYTDDAA